MSGIEVFQLLPSLNQDDTTQLHQHSLLELRVIILRLWPFYVVILSLTHILPVWLLALTLYMCISIHINFLYVFSLEQ